MNRTKLDAIHQSGRDHDLIRNILISEKTTMSLNKASILDILQRYCVLYNVSPSRIIVGAGAALVLHDCPWRKSTPDIDIILPAFMLTPLVGRLEVTVIKNGNVGLKVFSSPSLPVDAFYPPSVEDSWNIETTDVGGFQVETLASVLRFKQKLNRKKDALDITELRRFLKAKTTDESRFYVGQAVKAAMRWKLLQEEMPATPGLYLTLAQVNEPVFHGGELQVDRTDLRVSAWNGHSFTYMLGGKEYDDHTILAWQNLPPALTQTQIESL